jgi:hypothetical protein
VAGVVGGGDSRSTKQIRLAFQAPDEVTIMRGELVIPAGMTEGLGMAKGRTSSP